MLERCGPDDVVIADANGRYTTQAGVVAARLLARFDRVYIEQPCPTLEACRYVREHTSLPFILDECISDVPSLMRAHEARAMEAFNLKISKVGGLTRARQMRDLAESLGIAVTIEDTWGGDLVTAAVSHLAASTREQNLFTVSFMNDWTNEHVAGYEPRSADGRGSAPTGPGLGVEVDLAALGAPLFVLEEQAVEPADEPGPALDARAAARSEPETKIPGSPCSSWRMISRSPGSPKTTSTAGPQPGRRIECTWAPPIAAPRASGGPIGSAGAGVTSPVRSW